MGEKIIFKASFQSATPVQMPYPSLTSLSTLIPGEKLTSANGLYILLLQVDGNLVGYQNGSTPFWSTGTINIGLEPRHLTIQIDGNLVLYDNNYVVLWHTDTANQGTFPYRIVLQDDRNLVLYDINDNVLWNADTRV